MKKIAGAVALGLILTLALITRIPATEAGAASSASGFQMDGTTLVRYTGTASTVSIPSTVEEIGESAFEDNLTVERVVIPNSVTSIGAYAFWGCENLRSVSLGKGLYEISDFAFTNCPALQSVNIPDNISRIGIMAFADCISMTDIYIPKEVFSIHETAFDGDYQLTIRCEEGTYAAEYRDSFLDKQALMVVYATPVPTAAPTAAPYYTEVTPTPAPTAAPVQGTILGSTSIVGNMAVVFMDSTRPYVEGSSAGGSQFQPGSQVPVIVNGEVWPGVIATIEQPQASEQPEVSKNTPEQQTASPETEPDGAQSHTVVISDTVPAWSYYGDTHLGAVEVPGSVESVEEFAYARSSATQITLPDSVTHIGYAAFYHCDSLEDIVIPASVTSIDAKAFTYTPWLERFYQEGTEDFLIVGDGILLAYRGNSRAVTIPEGVKTIAPEVFENHTEIRQVNIPDTVTSIAEDAFEGCDNLEF